MTMPNFPEWTAEEIAAYSLRYGLSLSDPLMARLRELANKVSEGGRAIPRMPSEDFEPALTFTVHTE
jgi:hypothetical protein